MVSVGKFRSRILFAAFLTFGFFLLASLAYGWTSPASNPPNGNVATPLNTGSGSQTKSGSFSIGGTLGVTGTTTLTGNVGAGVSPAYKLHVYGAVPSDFVSKIESTNQYGLFIKTVGTTASHDQIKVDDNSGTVFGVYGTGQGYFKGSVGIGDTSPDMALDIENGYIHAVNSGVYATPGEYGAYFGADNGARAIVGCHNPSSQCQLNFYTTNGGTHANRLSIAGDGTFTGSASNDISDIRFKENISVVTSSLDKILNLRGVRFNWKKEANMTDRPQLGVIAQEVEQSFPELVVNASIMGEGYKSVQYGGFVAPFIESIKELEAKNRNLEAKVKELEERIISLESR